MKINDLIEVKFEPEQKSTFVPGVNTDPENKYLGAGAQAIVYIDAKVPNAVIKMIAISGADDPAYQFIRICVNNPNNPWLPKIYAKPTQHPRRKITSKELEYIEDNTDYSLPMIDEYLTSHPYVLIVSMEQLFPLNTDNDSLINLFQIQLGPAYSIIDSIDHSKTSIKIVRAFKNPDLRLQMRQTTSNKNFAQAMRLLEPLLKHPQYEPDMHVNNFMLRGDQQLVIIDPVTRFFEED